MEKIKILVLCLIIGIIPISSFGLTSTFTPIKDNFIQGNAPNDNNGARTDINIYSRSGQPYRALVSFDISSLPTEIIDSATFSVYYYGWTITNPDGQNAQVCKLNRNDWTELGSSYNNYKSATAWTTAGGDFNCSSPTSTTATFGSSYGFIDFDITNIVNDAIENNNSIVDLMLKFQTEGSTWYYAYLYSRDYTTDLNKRPKLAIDYSSTSTTTPTSSDFDFTELNFLTTIIFSIIIFLFSLLLWKN